MLYAKGVGDASLGLLPQGGYPGISDQTPLVPEPQRGSAGPPFKETSPSMAVASGTTLWFKTGIGGRPGVAALSGNPRLASTTPVALVTWDQSMMICEDIA